MFQNNVIHVDEVTSYLALPKVYPNDLYLAISATSTPSERLFSEAGNVMTIKRIQMASNTLENLVFLYLAISATSTPSERLFSEAGNVMTIKRIQMASNTLENLVFCKKIWCLGALFVIKVIYVLHLNAYAYTQNREENSQPDDLRLNNDTSLSLNVNETDEKTDLIDFEDLN
ncbi:hypothetical protein Glove_23g161 [Diversispora epigaea]|uniref:HAT C-terminal dimerisation domain-containing protein n=1 Tax=Diversispora epigaea TaxID=1348612 RepID=A0A397JLV4_9GLOM|nr:hypothetical protein Glove_23g161 [Diversispora epigaea]